MIINNLFIIIRRKAMSLIQKLSDEILGVVKLAVISTPTLSLIEKLDNDSLIFHISLPDDTNISHRAVADIYQNLEAIWQNKIFTGEKGKYRFLFPFDSNAITFHISLSGIRLICDLPFSLIT